MSDVDEVARGARCYRHPDRPAPLSCTRCGRPICLECAVDAPVGYLCPDDARTNPRQRRAARQVARAGSAGTTRLLVGIVAVVYVAQAVLGRGLVLNFGLFGPAVDAGEYWRVLTSGFLHGGLIHVGFNGYLLYALGNMLEPAMRTSGYLATFLAGLFGGSAGALLLSYDALTIGASGAVFGLMGAAMVGLRARGINPWSTSIGTLLILNLVFTFIGGNISIGGHLGGLAGGFVAGLVVFRGDQRLRTVGAWAVAIGLGALAVAVGVFGWSTGLGM